jgi:ubiquitin C-terminal hydrolase
MLARAMPLLCQKIRLLDKEGQELEQGEAVPDEVEVVVMGEARIDSRNDPGRDKTIDIE